jgi:hypothetical protein
MSKALLSTLAAGIFCSACAPAALVVLDNLDIPTPVTTGAQSNYRVQSFTPNVAAIGSSDTVAANSPLPATVYLDRVTFLSTPVSGSGDTAGQIFIDVYLGDGDDGTYVGSSTNSINVKGSANSIELTWTFADFALDSTQEYAFVFSTDAIAGSSAIARLTAANTGAGFVNTYNGGTADLDGNNNSPVNFDTRFQVLFNTVPEPTAALLGGIGMLALLRRRHGGRRAR